MITRIANGRVWTEGRFVDADVYVEDGKILSVGGAYPCERTVDAKGGYVTAGFVDIHCHGGGGYDFNSGDRAAVAAAAGTHLAFGTTTLFPTVTSADAEGMIRAIEAIEAARADAPSLAGIHLEGPYFSPSQMGAQNGSTLRPPQREEYEPILKKYNIARWDYAPDRDPDFSFLEALLAHGVLPAAAHTDATCREMEAAADRGCRLVTHLYSCTSTVRREKGFRIAGVLEATYLRDDICAELIADGCHLPPELLRLAYKCKGADRLALVTDSMSAGGTDREGEFELGGVRCIVEDGVAKLLDRSAFAGSVATADRLVRTCVAAGIPLSDAFKMMSETPAAMMGLTGKGRIAPRMDADIVILNSELFVTGVMLGGKLIREE